MGNGQHFGASLLLELGEILPEVLGILAALIGFEWTAIGGFNLHRNVIFRGDASVANRTIPYSQYD
ncbi:MAG: DUF3604 domain-containing protein, partial [Pseudolabrys sp.]